jgi:hypothetical protein
MPWNANDASRQAVQRPAQQQQRSHRGNQQRAAGQMNDLLAQYRSALGGPAAGNSSWHSGPAGSPVVIHAHSPALGRACVRAGHPLRTCRREDPTAIGEWR